MKTDPIYSFEVERSLLLALALFQSADETRVVLNATKFELRAIGGKHELTLIATDGKRLATHTDEVLEVELTDEMPEHSNMVLDLKGVKKLPKIKGDTVVRVTVYEKHVVFSSGKFRYEATPVTAAPFPEWRQCMPAGSPIPVADFPVNFAYLASFGQAAHLITEKRHVTLHAFGEGAAIGVTFPQYRQFRGVVMPIRLNDDDDKGVERKETTKEKATA
jgi:hypothetical protein